MATSMIVHDTRLQGATPLNYNYVLEVNAKIGIDYVVGRVTHFGRIQKLAGLHIFCHGFEADWNLTAQMCMPTAHGGFGLQLCKEGLTLFNVSKTAAWKGLVQQIVLFACAPADTGEGNAGTYGDGKRFCGELALWSNAEVIAARDTQYYNQSAATYSGGRSVANTIDFGAWEGPVCKFTPENPDGEPYLALPYNKAQPLKA
jgi:hypothetical protein